MLAYRALKLSPPNLALSEFISSVKVRMGSEAVSVEASCGRVLAEAVYSNTRIPATDIAAMDGYALRSADVTKATPANPVRLEVVEELSAESKPKVRIRAGQATAVSCGAQIPDGADAVARVEHVRLMGECIEVCIDVPKGKNICCAGEDLEKGTVFRVGHLVKPQDVELMIAAGVADVKVVRRPRVAILSTGDELSLQPNGGRTVCSHAYSIAAMLRLLGADPLFLGIAPDSVASIRSKVAKGLKVADFVITIAGVSVGEKDLVAEAIRSLPRSKVIAHGVAIHPGRPLTLSVVGGKAVVSLPGHVASTTASFYLVVPRLLRRMTGSIPSLPMVKARLAEDYQSRNLHELVRVRLERVNGGTIARPLRGNINLMRLMSESNGFFIAPPRTSYTPGEEIEVLLYSPYEFANVAKDWKSEDDGTTTSSSLTWI